MDDLQLVWSMDRPLLWEIVTEELPRGWVWRIVLKQEKSLDVYVTLTEHYPRNDTITTYIADASGLVWTPSDDATYLHTDPQIAINSLLMDFVTNAMRAQKQALAIANFISPDPRRGWVPQVRN